MQESSPKRTLRDVWENVIYHLSTHDRHHSLTQSQSVTGRIHTRAHTHTLGDTHPTRPQIPTDSRLSHPPLDGREGFSTPHPVPPSCPLTSPLPAPPPSLPCVVFF